MGGFVGSIGNAFGSIFRNPVKAILPIAGTIVAGPVGGAMGGALSGAMNGGNGNDILRNVGIGAVSAGVGAHFASSAAASTTLKSISPTLASFLSATQPVIGATGALMGFNLGQNLSGNYIHSASNAESAPNIPTQSFEQLRENAMAATESAFRRERVPYIYDSPVRRRMQNTHLDIYNRYRYPTIKEVKKSFRRRYG
jgi:hypothetical protein